MSKSYCPKVFAHRGSNTLAPENSRPAFDLALMEGADGFETDIQLSRDFTPLLWHDDDLQRIGMPTRTIDEFFKEELELLDISLLCSEFHRFCGILSLEDFLRHYFSRTPLLLELKDIKDDNILVIEDKIKSILDRLTEARIPPHKVMMSSFELNLLEIVNKYTTKNFLVANIEDKNDSETLPKLVKKMPFLQGVCLDKKLVNPEVINTAKKLKLLTLTYTCNEEKEIRSVFDSGIDIIISDIPGQCKKIVNKLVSNN